MSINREIIILEVSPDELRICQARTSNGPVEFLEACSFLARDPRSDKSAVQDQGVLDALSAFVSERQWVGKDLMCLLSGPYVSCQYFDMPPLKGAALRQAVLLKLDQQLHFDVEDAIVDIQSIEAPHPNNRNQLRVAVTALRREAAEAALDVATRLGLNVAAISAAPVALTALARGTVGDTDESQAVLHVGERVSTLVVLNGQTPCVTSELPIGMSDFTAALMRPIIKGDDVIELDEEKAAALRDEVGIPDVNQEIDSLGVTGIRVLPLLEPTLQKFAQHLTQWLTYAATLEHGGKVSRMKVVGGGVAMPGLSSAVGHRVGLDVEEARWLDGLATVSGQASDVCIESFAIAAGVARHWQDLPDLIPPEIRQQRMLRRVRRSTVLVCPIVAAAVFGLAFLFDQAGSKVQSAYGAHLDKLDDVRQIVGSNNRWIEERKIVEGLQNRFDEFARSTPRWAGLFMELSRLLPSELQATKFNAESDSDGISMEIEANVYTTLQGRSFDEVVEQTLLSLERSPFFKRVELLNSNKRMEQTEDHTEAGSLFVELELVYPRAKTGA